jgi:CHAT domain-containing protein/Tfp pilus assembly protein PilF
MRDPGRSSSAIDFAVRTVFPRYAERRATSQFYLPRITFAVLALASNALRSQSLAQGPQDSPIMAGVVVEEVASDSEGAKAGLQIGDTIIAYSRNSASASIGSPFDWARLEASQFSGVRLTLRGMRRTEEMIWTMGTGFWGITTGPLLGGDLDASYHRCRGLVLSEKYIDALQCWPSVIKEVRVTDPAWFPIWLVEQILASISKERVWKESDETVATILQFSEAGGGLTGTANMLQGLGGVSQLHGNTKKAEEYYRRALATWDKVVPNSIDSARLLNILGSLAIDTEDPGKAGEEYNRALLVLAGLTPGNGDTGNTLNGLGLVAERLHDWDKAVAYYRRALAIREKLAPGSLLVATTLYNLAEPLYRRGDLAQAEEYYSQALAIRERLAPNSSDVAVCLYMLGLVASDRGVLAKAEEYHRRALQVYERLLPGSLDASRVMNGLGVDFVREGNLEKAAKYHQQALAIQTELAPRSAEIVVSLGELGNVSSESGDLVAAEAFYQRALVIQREIDPGDPDIALTLEHLGLLAQYRGETAKADEYFHQDSAIIAKFLTDSPEFARSLTNLAELANARGDLSLADEYFRKALAIYEKLSPGSLSFAWSLDKLGKLAMKRLDYAGAELYARQALAIYTKLAPDSAYVAGCFNDLGNAASGRPDLQKEEAFYKQALAIYTRLAPASTNTASVLTNLGNVALAEHKLVEAERYYRDSLDMTRKLTGSRVNLALTLLALGDVERERGAAKEAERNYREGLEIIELISPGSDTHARLLNALGLILFGRGEVREAADCFQRAVDALENQTARLGGSQESRWSFRSSFLDYYGAYVSALVSLKQGERAFDISEKARAREFLSMLAERDLVFAKDVSSEIQQARRMNAAAYDHTQEQLSKLDPAKNGQQRERLIGRLQELMAERGEIAERIRQISPDFAALQYPQPLDLTGARRMLDAGTALLSYAVGAEASTLFVVQATGKEPALSVLSLPVGEKKLRRQVEEFRKLILQRRSITDSVFVAKARVLYDELVKPAEALFTSNERLLIVPDLPLYSLPFAALLRTRNQYLVEWKPLHTVLSATVYAELQKRRQVGQKAVELVAFGDPHYAAASRLRTESISQSDVRSVLPGLSLSPLPFSRAEVDGIAAIYREKSLKYLGEDATEEHAKAIGKDVRYIHFAVHGLMDDRLPLNSALAFTTPERIAPGKENGLLEAWEIFEQVRLDADLVTLSACNSGMGQEQPGEGLIGLTRAFQYAGARAVLASLWSVDDMRTMELMKQFYTALRSGKSKDEALRSAQIRLLNFPPSSSPFYWAAFTLNGDWR